MRPKSAAANCSVTPRAIKAFDRRAPSESALWIGSCGRGQDPRGERGPMSTVYDSLFGEPSV